MVSGNRINLTHRQRRASAGFSLLEVLIALVILSVGLLGIAALMSTALKSNDSAYMRTQATVMAYNIIDRMRANMPGVNNLAYVVSMPANASTATVYPVTCIGAGAGCTSSTLATYDINQWEYDLAQQLPGGRGAVSVTIGPSATTATVTVLWNDSRAHDSLQKTGAPTATTFSLSVLAGL